MILNDSNDDRGEVRLIKTQDEWHQFIEMTQNNFPEFRNILKNEKLEYHTEEDKSLFGYFINEEIVGSLGFQIIDHQNLGLLGYFQVKKTVRGQGIAKLLFSEVINLLQEKKCRYFSIWVLEYNKEAIKIYEKWGFKKIPVIYNVTLTKERRRIRKVNPKSKRTFLLKKKQIEKILTEMLRDYLFFNEVFHVLDDLYMLYPEKSVFSRKISNVTHLVGLKFESNNIIYYRYFLLRKRGNNLESLEEELLDLFSLKNSNKTVITIYGKLKQDEINRIQELGFDFKFPFEMRAYLLKIKKV